MKRILYLVSTLQKAGPTNQLSYIIKYLDKNKYEPIVVTLSPEFKSSMIDYYKIDLNIRVETLNLSRIKGLFFAKQKVENFIKENNIDLIHTQGFRADVLSAKLNINIPKVATIRNYPQLDFPMTYGKYKGFLMTKLQIKALKKLNLCCGVSDAVAKNLKNTFGLKNIATVRNGVDMDKYFPLTKNEQKTMQSHLKLPNNIKIWISSIGKDLRKDSTIIAKAFKKLYEEDKNNFIIFIGDGELRIECETILSKNENTLFTGKINNVLDYLQSSHYFISSSQAEGLPNAVLEAMACGLPQVLSDIEPHKEIIKLDKKTGVIYKTGSIDELYNAMKDIINCNYEDTSKSVLDLIKNNLESSKMSNNYQDIYNNLIGEEFDI